MISEFVTHAGQIGPTTRVFVTRRLRTDVPDVALPRFQDTVWDFSVCNFEEHSIKQSLNFALFPVKWREAVKVYFWILINEEQGRAIQNGPARGRLSLTSIAQLQGPLRRIVEWTEARGLESMSFLTDADLDDLLVELSAQGLTDAPMRSIITETRRLWVYRDAVPTLIRLPERSPWQDYHPRDLLQLKTTSSTNLTPRISDDTLVPLMIWAFRFVEDFADDIIAGYRDYRTLIRTDFRHRAPGLDPSKVPGARRTELANVLTELQQSSKGLPGHNSAERPGINWTHLGRLSGYFGTSHRASDQDLIDASGLRIDSGSYVRPICRGLIDDQLWRTPSIAWAQAVPVADHLVTASFMVIAYLTGMRPGEVLSIRRDSLVHEPESGLWLITSTHWKSARATDGSKLDEGEVRATPWVVHPLGALAIQVLERLHDQDLLFPKNLRPAAVRGSTPPQNLRAGSARTTARITTDIERFTDWVNAYCDENSRRDKIPADQHGRITGRRFRRTLAWHIVRRPRGLVAAAIQYGHVATQITQGYAGSYASGFPTELAMERWLERMDHTVALNDYVSAGGHVSGPAASELEHRTSRATSKYLGRTIPTRRQAEKLLGDPLLQVFPGEGLHCVFNFETALCAKTAKGPAISDCRSACKNIARTDSDIAQIRKSSAELLSDRLAPPIRHDRMKQLALQNRRVVRGHEKTRPK